MKLWTKMSHKFGKEICFISLPGYHAYFGIQKFGGGKYPENTCGRYMGF